MAAYEVLLLNTAVPQIQAAQSGDTYVVPRDIAFSAALTLSAGTANGVPYLNGSKVLTSGTALTFDGTNLALTTTAAIYKVPTAGGSLFDAGGNNGIYILGSSNYVATYAAGSEQMRLTSTGLGIGTSSPSGRLSVKAPTGNGIVEVVTGLTTADSIRLSAGGSVTNWLEYRGYLGHVWFDNAGEKMRLDSSGYLRMASGTGGIQFNGDTAAANALDDYEEGTWTITLTPETSGSIPTNTALDAGSYTKVGRVVTVTGCVNLGSPSSPVGTYISLSLPFAVADLSELSGRFGGAVSFNDGGVLTNVPIQAIEGETAFRIVMDASTVASGDQFYFSVSYFTT